MKEKNPMNFKNLFIQKFIYTAIKTFLKCSGFLKVKFLLDFCYVVTIRIAIYIKTLNNIY